jgi:ribosome-associated heat shock protein Hsp15
LYRRNDTPPEAFAHLELLKLSKEHYRKSGTGRPTKKDRRDIDEYGNEIPEDLYDTTL